MTDPDNNLNSMQHLWVAKICSSRSVNVITSFGVILHIFTVYVLIALIKQDGGDYKQNCISFLTIKKNSVLIAKIHMLVREGRRCWVAGELVQTA